MNFFRFLRHRLVHHFLEIHIVFADLLERSQPKQRLLVRVLIFFWHSILGESLLKLLIVDSTVLYSFVQGLVALALDDILVLMECHRSTDADHVPDEEGELSEANEPDDRRHDSQVRASEVADHVVDDNDGRHDKRAQPRASQGELRGNLDVPQRLLG